jgi:uncharacterized repeat protein (TIGR03943 family)
MRFTWQVPRRLPQLAVFAGLGLFLLRALLSGEFYWYLSDRLFWLVVVSTAIFLAIPVILVAGEWADRVRPADRAPDHGSGAPDEELDPEPMPGMRLVMMALPLILGVIVPARPLSASAVSNKDLNGTAALAVGTTAQAATLANTPAAQYTILDWVRETNSHADSQRLDGQSADVIGFVDHDQRLAAGQFLVGRYAITHCIAEAVAVGMIVEWPQAAPPADAWVRVKGLVTMATLGGKPVPKISAESVEVVPQPARPYLYP